ncbi:hypothetical protein [Flavobacterium sp.]|uniref:hypothetical protein n=1 Tax=Flavobacterium sp. TaxID=239 RepID=UPI0040331EC8
MKYYHYLFIVLFLFSCQKETKEKQPILLADREAPLGWVYLRIYPDSTFEFETRGLRDRNLFDGKAEITRDTLFFHYIDSIPYAGTKAVYTKGSVNYTNGAGKTHESLEIKFSKLNK